MNLHHTSRQLKASRGIMSAFSRAGIAAAGVILIGGLTGLACGSDGGEPGASGDTIKIGAIVPSSGPVAHWGKGNTVVLEMLESEVNRSGGVNGKKLKLVIYDDAADPAQSASLVRKLATADGALAIAGPLTSSSAEVGFPIANQLKVPAVSQASSKPGVAAANRPWAFRNTVDEGVFAGATGRRFKEDYDVKTAAIIYDSEDAVSTSLGTKVFPAALKKEGIDVVNASKPTSFQTEDVDVSSQVTSLRSLNPDGIVIAADYSPAVTVVREMKKQGLAKPVLGGSPLVSTAILKAAPEIPIIAPATYFVGLDESGAEEFTKKATAALRAAGESDLEPTMFDANIYESVRMFLEAVDRAPDGEVSREQVRDYLAGVSNFKGIVGPIAFNKDGDAVKNFYVIAGKDGSWKPISKCDSKSPPECS